MLHQYLWLGGHNSIECSDTTSMAVSARGSPRSLHITAILEESRRGRLES